MFDRGHNPSHSTLYPDVLKIKTIIVAKQIFSKMPFVYYLQITNPYLATLRLGRPGSRVAGLWICKFVIIKQMAFLQIIVSQQLLFLFSKHLDTMLNVTDCGTGRTDLCLIVGNAATSSPSGY